MENSNELKRERRISALRSESSTDYTLPDYNTDIKRVLYVTARVLPAGKFLGEDAVEFSGVIEVGVVYLDVENTVTHAEFTSDYDIKVRTSGDDYVDSDIITRIINSNLRLSGPRKLSYKAQLENDVFISENAELLLEGDALGECELERREIDTSVMTADYYSSEERESAEEIMMLEGVILDEVDIISAEAQTYVKDVSISGGKADIKCDCALTLLYRVAGGELKTAEHTISIPETIELGEIPEVYEPLARCELLSLRVTLDPRDDGVSLIMSVITVSKLRLVYNMKTKLLLDAYVCERGSVASYSDYREYSFVEAIKLEEPFTSKMPLTDAADEGARSVLLSSFSVSSSRCEVKGENIEISGEIRISGIACRDFSDEENDCVPIRATVPFSKNVNNSCHYDDAVKLDCSFKPVSCRLDIEGNEMLVGCSFELILEARREVTERVLSALSLTDEEYPRDSSVVTVYYPESGETLFGIAKRYHTSVASIAEDNALSEAVFSESGEGLSALGVKRLVIKG